MKELKATGLTQSIGVKQLFKSVDISLMSGDKVGLIGINGTGKTTLLNTLVGLNAPESGYITHPKQYKIAYLRQKNTLNPMISVLDTVFEGDNQLMNTVREYELCVEKLQQDPNSAEYQKLFSQSEQKMNQVDGWQATSKATSILTQLGITEMNKKVGELSGGQQKRVQLAQVLIQPSDLLVLDEPTNHLDYDMIEWLEKYLSGYKGTLLMVTHDRYFLDHVVNQIIELTHGSLHRYPGNYQQYIQQKAEREALDSQKSHKVQQLYKQELAWMREGVRARGTKQQARINRFQELKEQVLTQDKTDHIELNLKGSRLGTKVLELEDASFTRNDQVILDTFNLLIQNDSRIGITGENGSGKSTFLDILAGKIKLNSGGLNVGETVRIAYYTQNNAKMDESKRVIDFLREIAEEVEMADGSRISVAQVLEQFMFSRHTQGAYISSLSGGEKRRLFLVQLLIQQPNVLILDEPTNDLDTETLTVLEQYISQFSGAVIAVSHDRYFLDKVAQQLLIFKGNGKIETYWGSITQYLKLSSTGENPQESLSKKVTQSIEVKSQKKSDRKRLTYMEKKEWETIEDDISQLEHSIEEVEAMMLTISGSDYGHLCELNETKKRLDQALDEKIARWEYLAEQLEGE